MINKPSKITNADRIIGDRFGKLVVKRRDDKRHFVICDCDCGNEKAIKTGSLISGGTQSCGCLRHQFDLTGQRFGRLTVIGVQQKPYMQICRCDCGNQAIAKSYALRSGHTKSCGCIGSGVKPTTDLTGHRFGKLVVIGVQKNPYGQICQCDCGNQTIVHYPHALKSGNTRSCGCLTRSDLTGQRFSRLTVIGVQHNPFMQVCRCDCGRERAIGTCALRSGLNTTCGAGCPYKKKIWKTKQPAGFQQNSARMQSQLRCQ